MLENQKDETEKVFYTANSFLVEIYVTLILFLVLVLSISYFGFRSTFGLVSTSALVLWILFVVGFTYQRKKSYLVVTEDKLKFKEFGFKLKEFSIKEIKYIDDLSRYPVFFTGNLGLAITNDQGKKVS